MSGAPQAIKSLRLGSGLVLAAFLLPHLVNVALGLFSFDAMESLRALTSPIWRSLPDTIALYGALLTHVGLALYSLYRRSTLRMPAWEAIQLGFGLCIVPLVLGHAIGTRLPAELIDVDSTYMRVMAVLWGNPRLTVQQPVLLVVVWVHLTVGLHYWLRLRPWYPRLLPVLYAAAILVPSLALLGFIKAGMTARDWLSDPTLMAVILREWNAADAQARAFIGSLEAQALAGSAAVFAAVLAARWLHGVRRRRSGTVRITHANGRVIRAPSGQTLLEALRAAGIPHASVCGGRARCTTCRVRVGEGLDSLPQPSPMETAALKRVGAQPNVRLACQTRAQADVAVTPLLPPTASAGDGRRPGGVEGHEQKVTAIFVDLRGSTRLGEDRLPYDVVFVLNQFFAEMSAALHDTGGHYAQFAGDGLMGLYGLSGEFGDGCRASLRGAREMFVRLQRLNERLRADLKEPLQMGIGIHSGEAIVGTMGPPMSPNLSAIGDNINVAARLEGLTKDYGCRVVISAATAEGGGVELSAFPVHTAAVRGRGKAVRVYAVNDPTTIPGL